MCLSTGPCGLHGLGGWVPSKRSSMCLRALFSFPCCCIKGNLSLLDFRSRGLQQMDANMADDFLIHSRSCLDGLVYCVTWFTQIRPSHVALGANNSMWTVLAQSLFPFFEYERVAPRAFGSPMSATSPGRLPQFGGFDYNFILSVKTNKVLCYFVFVTTWLSV